MERKRIIGISIAAAAVVAIIAAVFVIPLFLPEKTTQLDEGLPPGMTDQMVAENALGGVLRGEDGHRASGSVQLLDVDGAWYLRFEDLEMTAGPDIYLYLIESEGSSRDKINNGERIPVVTEEDRTARINERGTFNVLLPDLIDPTEFGGISVWCDRFGVPFATSPLA